MLRITPQSVPHAVMRGLLLLVIAILLAVLALLLMVPSAPAQQPDTLRATMVPLVGVQTEGQLGSSVAIDGPYVVAGAWLDDIGAMDSGVVKVFDSATGALLLALPNPDPGPEDWFGTSVAISGTRVIVGAPRDSNGMMNCGFVYVYDLSSATPTVPTIILSNPSPVNDDRFGFSLAISGSRLVVGAYQDDTGAPNAGSAYVYDLDSATPTIPVATLDNPDPAPDDFFGWSVAISGLRVVVGVYEDDTGAENAGCAYVYDLASAAPTVPVVMLKSPSPAAANLFGGSVAISGTRVIVGEFGDDTQAYNAGRAYVYDLSGATPTVPMVTLNNPDPDAYDSFGLSVAISNTRVVVNAAGDDAGAGLSFAGSAYVYDLDSTNPTVPVATLNNPSPQTSDLFASSIAIAGTRLVVGAPRDDTRAFAAGSVYVYDLASAAPTVPVATLNDPGPGSHDSFGFSVAISGILVVAGAPGIVGSSHVGTAYVYDLGSATSTSPVITLHNPSPARGDSFGNSVAISGNRVVVGAYQDNTENTYANSYAGSAYVYDLGGAAPTLPVVTLNNPSPAYGDYFGYAVAISGTHVVVGAAGDDAGAPDAGTTYVYDLRSTTPAVPMVTLRNPSPVGGDFFGASVAISGTHVVIGASYNNTGAPDAGSTYVYDLSSATATVPIATLRNPDPADGDYFGVSVAIDGTRVVVGATGTDAGAVNTGIAYVYDLSSGTPTVPMFTLRNPSPADGEHFGGSVGISGTRIVVGAASDITGATNAGSAYVYDLSSSSPTVSLATLNNPRPAADDYFGYAVAIDGTTVAIGTPDDHQVMPYKGAIDIFTPANPDFDGDGLLDLWEHAHFGSIAAHTALDDTDGDGRKELLELAFNTDPLFSDPAAAPAVVSEGGFLTMTLSKRAGVSYTVESADSPEDTAFSMATTTTITNNASTLKVRDNFTPASAAQRFLRVKVNPAP
jgi:hypothetical protein